METAATTGRRVKCPLCDAELEWATTETRQDEFASYVVVTDPGTAWVHIRDEHPERWAEMREARRKMNANPFIGCMPRKVDGTFLLAGEDVCDIAVRAEVRYASG